MKKTKKNSKTIEKNKSFEFSNDSFKQMNLKLIRR